jgi:putative transposase
MNTFKRHPFPPDIISYAVWLYYHFNLRHCRCAGPFIEDLPAERGITVTREAIRLWYIKFGAIYTRRLERKHRGYGDTFFIDEVFVQINGKQHYLWRAVDQDGEVVDVYLQAQRFVTAHAAVQNLFNLGRHLVRAEHYRNLRVSAFSEWSRAVA